MTEEEKKIIALAKHFITCILENHGDIKAYGLADLYEINSGNKELLIEHLNAVSSIMQRAVKLLESGEDVSELIITQSKDE